MGDHSAIEWTSATWNPLRGCSRVSEGCRNCYAERIAGRFSYEGGAYERVADTVATKGGTRSEGRWNGRVEFIEEALSLPLRWKKPRRIFVNSMSDLFHERVHDHWIAAIFDVMYQADRHAFQVLTKRPERMRDWCLHNTVRGLRLTDKPLPNVHLGVSVEDQATADERIPLLLQTPAAVRFLSVEPLLGDVDLGLGRWIRLPRPVRSELPFSDAYLPVGVYRAKSNPHGALSVEQPTRYDGLLGVKPAEFERLPLLDWVIVGGESGPGARPMHPDWARGVRDQCLAAGVPFFFKQWGEWAPFGPVDNPQGSGPDPRYLSMALDRVDLLGRMQAHADYEPRGAWRMSRVGKKAAGALLDGREWREFPDA